MKGERTPLSKGLWFGLVTGLFGGLFWSLIVFLETEDAPTKLRWFLIGGGLLFWFGVGFLIGVFNAPRATDGLIRSEKEGDPLALRMLIVIAWYLYRLLVGCFVGVLATIVFAFFSFTPLFILDRFGLGPGASSSYDPVRNALLNSLAVGVCCCFSGGVFGAVVGPRGAPSQRPAIGSRAIRSSFLSFLLGILFGASLDQIDGETSKLFFCLGASIPIGILGGILGGIWTDIRNLRRAEQSMALEERRRGGCS